MLEYKIFTTNYHNKQNEKRDTAPKIPVIWIMSAFQISKCKNEKRYHQLTSSVPEKYATVRFRPS